LEGCWTKMAMENNTEGEGTEAMFDEGARENCENGTGLGLVGLLLPAAGPQTGKGRQGTGLRGGQKGPGHEDLYKRSRP